MESLQLKRINQSSARFGKEVEKSKRRFPEDYYKKALEICVEFNDRYSQARTYHQLGTVAQKQRQWDTARENLIKALEILVEFEDQQNVKIVLRSLARLWQAAADQRVLTEAARVLSISEEDAKKLLEEAAKQ
jgi:Tfp pilus assembly protein PilF